VINELALYRVHIPEIEDWAVANGQEPPLVMGVCLRVLDKEVGFHDTNRGHAFAGHMEKETPDGFIWHRIEPELEPHDMGMIRFVIVDLPTFEKECRPRIIGWLPDKFSSTAELWEFYRRAYKNAGYHG
jgi:hypothetical protein